jgi:Domain of unknown function (DUF397)
MTNIPPTFSEADFRKSSWSEPDRDCVHVARRGGWVAVRDTKTVFGTADDHHLNFSAEQFEGLLNRLG